MVGGLLALLDLAELDVRVVGGLGDGAGQQVARHEVAAAAGREVAAAGQQAQGVAVDLLVAAAGVAHGLAALGEGRRVEHDEVEGAALVAQALAVAGELGEVVEDVRAGEAHARRAVGRDVERVGAGVFAREVDGRLAHVDAAHEVGAARGCVQAEGSDVAEAVEHATTRGELADRAAVVLLVEEEAGLLAVLDVEVEEDAVLAHDDAGVGAAALLDLREGVGACRRVVGYPGAGGGVDGAGRGEVVEALLEGEAVLGAGGGVVALVDRADGLAVGGEDREEERVDGRAQALHADGADLGDEDVLVAVDDEAAEGVGLGEEQATAVGVGLAAGQGARAHAGLAVRPGPLELAGPEGRVEAVVGVAADDADADLALLGDEARALVGAVLLEDVDDVAVCGHAAALGRGLDGADLALEDPGVAALEGARRLLADDDLRIGAKLLHVCLPRRRAPDRAGSA